MKAVTADDLALQAQSIRGTLDRLEDDEAARQTLEVDGWLGVVPEVGGQFPLAPHAVTTVAEVSRSLRDLLVWGQLGAASTLADLGRSPVGRLGLVLDVAGGRATYVDAASAALCVVGPVDGVLYTIRGPVDVVPLVESLHPAGAVSRGTVNLDRADVLTDDPAAIERHETRLALLVAADALGAATASAERTEAFVREREVFGKHLSSYQVVQHKVVDMAIYGRLGRALVLAAASAERGEASRLAWAAKAMMAERAVWVAEQAIQLHGGTGFTWEARLHIAMRATQIDRNILGGQRRATSEVARRMQSQASTMQDRDAEPAR